MIPTPTSVSHCVSRIPGPRRLVLFLARSRALARRWPEGKRGEAGSAIVIDYRGAGKARQTPGTGALRDLSEEGRAAPETSRRGASGR
jgi:hypothetical protein